MKPETWSNIAYIALGALWFYTGHIGLASLAILLGTTSAYSHHTGDWLPDWGAMYAMMFGLVLHGLNIPPALGWFGFFIPYIFPNMKSSFAGIGAFWFVAFLLGANHILVAVLFALAFAIRQIAPQQADPYFQLCHSVWHGLTAIGFYYMI